MERLPKFWKKAPNEFLYYSFLTGLDDMPKIMFILHDIKLPATSPEHALRLYEVLRHPKMNQKTPQYNFTDTPTFVRRVLEFAPVRFKGHIIIQFKLLRDINVDML